MTNASRSGADAAVEFVNDVNEENSRVLGGAPSKDT
jgi:hypothetical protein